MEKFNDEILSLQSEVNKYSNSKKTNILKLNDINLPDSKKEFKILNFDSAPKIDFNKFMIVFPFLCFISFYYFKPDFIMIDNPHDKKGKRINYGKLVFVVFIITIVVYCVGSHYNLDK